jgi:hypothetical protein
MAGGFFCLLISRRNVVCSEWVEGCAVQEVHRSVPALKQLKGGLTGYRAYYAYDFSPLHLQMSMP